MQFGYDWAFVFNSLSFFFSAACISKLRSVRGASEPTQGLNETQVMRPWHEYREGLGYMRASPLILGIGLIGVGWASGGGAAQVLFTLFGEKVFNRGPRASAFVGIARRRPAGGRLVRALAREAYRAFLGYKRTVLFVYVVHGGSYVIFSQMRQFGLALIFLAISRAAVAVSSVLNIRELLQHVSDEYRGRVFATMETLTWSTMMLSMLGAGLASRTWSPRRSGPYRGGSAR